MAELTTNDALRDVLSRCHTIAVLGAHPVTSKAAYYVPEYLRTHGYRILPINPNYVGMTLHGAPVVPSLDDVDEPIDMIDVFRRSSALPMHVDEILALDPKPRVVWFQLGVRNDDVTRQLVRAGLDVVQDRCTMADHRRFSVGDQQSRQRR